MKKKMSILAALVLAVIVTGYSVSGTYAKYTSNKELSDSAKVALWDIKLGEKKLWESDATFNIFDYVDAGVKQTDGQVTGLIAPGTTGTVNVAGIKNDSEVKAKYEIKFTATEKDGDNTVDIPIEYQLGDSEWTTDISTLTQSGELEVGANATAAVTLKWRWSFENGISSDDADTALGKAGSATVEVKATITATQVD